MHVADADRDVALWPCAVLVLVHAASHELAEVHLLAGGRNLIGGAEFAELVNHLQALLHESVGSLLTSTLQGRLVFGDAIQGAADVAAGAAEHAERDRPR